ncbi:MAG: FAD-dependent monooxygenase [Mariprofundales bacterium]
MTNQQNNKYDCDVIIVGGALAGATLALALEASGLSVILAERTPIHEGDGRLIALSWATRQYLKSLGTWPQDISINTAINRILVCQTNGKAAVEMDCASLSTPAFGQVVASNNILRNIYSRLQNTQVMPSATLTDLNIYQDCVQAVIIDKKTSSKQNISAHLVVGADGQYSPVRTLADLPVWHKEHNRFAITANISISKAHRGLAIECFQKAGPLAFLPLDAYSMTIVWVEAPSDAARLLSMSDDEFCTALEKRAGDIVMSRLESITKVTQRRAHPLILTIAKKIAHKRVALIGNAAHAIHPVAGQGMNLGMRDVMLLSKLLNQTAVSTTNNDAGNAILLEKYHQQRMLDITRIVALTEGLNAIFAADWLGMQSLRELGLNGLQRQPYLRKAFTRRMAGVGSK